MTAQRARVGRMWLPLGLTLALLFGWPPAAGGAMTPEGTDPLRDHQWGLEQVRVEPAWERSRGAGALLAVVDTGIDYGHPDLLAVDPSTGEPASRVVGGNTFLGCGSDGCGDGGWRSGPPNRGEKGHPHGTHVAGIAAATAGNGEGIAGVAPDVSLLSVRVLSDQREAEAEWVADAIRWAVDQGADVINLSLGLPLPTMTVTRLTGDDGGITAAIAYAADNGVVVVAAAGNGGGLPGISSLCTDPAFQDGVVCVVATDFFERRSGYSSGPVKLDRLAVAAPGGDGGCRAGVVSTVPAGSAEPNCPYLPSAGTYVEMLGTSMAAPHVSGVAALLVAQGCDRDEVHALLRTTSRQPQDDARGEWTPEFGYGIVDADAASNATTGACTPDAEQESGETGFGDSPANSRRR